jgi:hypothetical protein
LELDGVKVGRHALRLDKLSGTDKLFSQFRRTLLTATVHRLHPFLAGETAEVCEKILAEQKIEAKKVDK